jgi:hypothetical protein
MSERCRALTSQGYRCRRSDTMEVSYHGDGEIYDYSGPTPSWVVVPLCSMHRKRDDKPHKAAGKRMKCESTK